MFEQAKLKLEWGNRHIRNLQTTIDQFIQGNHYDTVEKTDLNGNVSIAISPRQPIPPAIALTIGDAAHNLKTALDYATWELIGIDGGKQHPGLYFPSTPTQQNHKGLCKAIQTPRADTMDFFIGLKNYGDPPTGNRALRALHLLDRTEKHRVLTPIIGATRIPLMKITNSDGVVIAEDENCSYLPEKDGVVRFNIGAGNTVELKTANMTVDIFFAELPPLEGPHPALPMLGSMAQTVHNTLMEFDKFVSGRPK
jgi:hypothetical protein